MPAATPPEQKDLLRCIACGGVDDGKSTLLGRLIYANGGAADDELARIGADGAPDLSLLLDGLEAEREQGITIDVAYRSFQTPRRRFILADAPGHEQYTRNMLTGASTADLAIVLVDARKGVLTQARRHSFLVSLVGIRDVVLAVNKMDLVGFDQARFDAIVADYRAVADDLGLTVAAVPVCALGGDNVCEPSSAMPWCAGPTLLACLEDAPAASGDAGSAPFRMPVQLVSRTPDFRGLCGTIAAGSVRPGDAVRILPSSVGSSVARILVGFEDRPIAGAGDAVTLVLADDVDCARGDVIAAADDVPDLSDQFEAVLVWMDEAPMMPGRSYVMQIGTATTGASVTALKHRINVNTLAHEPARTLELNGIAVVNLALDRPVPFQPYEDSRELGGFILIDRLTHATAGAGMIRFALRRAQNVQWQTLTIDRAARAGQKGQTPRVVWFTGLSGAGKTTIADALARELQARGRHTFLLDGDNLRHGLNRDLGFTEPDRVENIRRAGEVARLMWDAGLIVLCSFISPYAEDRRRVRELFPDGDFVEVFVDAPLEEAMRRDPKGLYRKARAGELVNFTGVDSPYEPPENPEIHIDTTAMEPLEAVAMIANRLA